MKNMIKEQAYSAVFKIISSFFILMISVFNTDLIFAEKTNERINKKLKINEPAVDFTLEDADGNKFSLSQTRGKTVIISIAAYHDSKELKKKDFKENGEWIEAIKKRYNDKCIVIGMGKVKAYGPLKTFASKLVRKSYSVPFVIDWKGDVFDIYGHESSPTVVLIDKDGIIRQLQPGFIRLIRPGICLKKQTRF